MEILQDHRPEPPLNEMKQDGPTSPSVIAGPTLSEIDQGQLMAEHIDWFVGQAPGFIGATILKKAQYFDDDATQLAGRIEREGWHTDTGKGDNVYFRVSTTAERLPGLKRGGKADTKALPGFVLDIDTVGGHHAEQNLPTEEQALEAIALLPVAPSAIVHTGGGFHVYWAFADALVVTEGTTPDDLEDLNKRFHAAARSLIAHVGTFSSDEPFHVDSTDDLPRLIRLVGTHNHKGDEARLVTWQLHPDDGSGRHNPHDLVAAFEAEALTLEPLEDETPIVASISGSHLPDASITGSYLPDDGLPDTIGTLYEPDDLHGIVTRHFTEDLTLEGAFADAGLGTVEFEREDNGGKRYKWSGAQNASSFTYYPDDNTIVVFSASLGAQLDKRAGEGASLWSIAAHGSGMSTGEMSSATLSALRTGQELPALPTNLAAAAEAAKSEWEAVRPARPAPAPTVTATATATAAPPPPPPSPTGGDLPEDFFDSDPLRHIYDYAIAVGANPTATLYGTLAKVSSLAPIGEVIPGLPGAYSSSSPGLFVAVFGPSASGKSTAIKAAETLITTDPHDPNIMMNAAPKSGEGLSALLTMEHPGDPTKTVTRPHVFIPMTEGTMLTQAGQRQASQITQTLAAAWNSENISGHLANKKDSREVRAGQYNVGMVLGIQPDCADEFFGTSDLGLVQRFLFANALPPTTEDYKPGGWRAYKGTPRPTSLKWDQPTYKELTRADEVNDELWAWKKDPAFKDRFTGIDAHRPLLHHKVAANLAMLHQRTGITVEDWGKARQIVDCSAAIRDSMVRYLAAKADGVRLTKAKQAGANRTAELAAEERHVQEQLESGKIKVLEAVKKAGSGGITANAIGKNRFTGKGRTERVKEVAEILLDEGLIGGDLDGRLLPVD